MNTQHRFLLWSLLTFFVLIAGVFIWNQIYTYQTHFLAGTRPPAEITPTTPTTLPPLRPSDPSLGSKNARALTIVEFADYDCLYCRLIQTELNTAIKNSSRPIKLVWRDLPIPNGRTYGLVSALAARCAGDQGKFWDMHDRLYQLPTLDLTSIKGLAQQLSLDVTAFTTCISTGKYIPAIEEDVGIAKDHGITAAPTLFIGTQTLSGFGDAKEILNLIHANPLK